MPVGSFKSTPPPSANRTGPVHSFPLTELRPLYQPPAAVAAASQFTSTCNSTATYNSSSGAGVSRSSGLGGTGDSYAQVSAKQQQQQQQQPFTSKLSMVQDDVVSNSKKLILPCCVPTGCSVDGLITQSDIHCDAVRIICSNKQCTRGSFMHKICFDIWETNVVLKQLSLTGPARSWTEKQKQQNAWRKGYDLAYRACKCACNNGYLRKDLDWIPPSKVDESTGTDKKKRNRHRNRRNKSKVGNNTLQLTSGASSAGCGVGGGGSAASALSTNTSGFGGAIASLDRGEKKLHDHTHHVSISNCSSKSSSVALIGSSTSCSSASNGIRNRTFSFSSTGSSGTTSGSSSAGGKMTPPISRADSTAFLNHEAHHDTEDRKVMLDYVKDMSFPCIIIDSRADYSTFQRLPRQKCNGYYIRVEDDNKRPDDEKIRKLILLTLRANRTNRMSCVICKSNLPIFGKFPMIDGTFFLSPKSYISPGLPVDTKSNGPHYLNALCISCLEGWCQDLICVYCGQIWIGNRLILGSMYSYDIFASRDCCENRLCCNSCKKPIARKLDLFCEYSKRIKCTHCGVEDYHFIKPLNETFVQRERHQMSIPRLEPILEPFLLHQLHPAPRLHSIINK